MTGGDASRAAHVPGIELVMLQIFGLGALLKVIGLMAVKWPNGKVYLWGRDRQAGWFVFVFAEGEDGRDFLVTAPDLMGLEAGLDGVLAIAGSVRALS